MDYKICPNCNKKVNTDAQHCMYCGAHIDYNSTNINPAYAQPSSFDTSAQALPNPKHKRKLSKKAIIAIVLVAVILVTVVLRSAISSITSNSETNTIMVYMVGSDLESQYGAGSNDIAEMASSGINFKKNNVIVYTGGSSYWNLDIPTDYNSVLQISENDFKIAGSSNAPLDMGEANTLTNYLQFCYDNYKTDHYSLVLWNHGGGPLVGYGKDELYEGDTLMLSEIDSALANSPFTGENKLDWVGFDACLMGSIEIAGVMSKYADYMIASQETEPGCGWDYSFLSEYNTTSDSEKIAERIIDKYYETIESMSSPSFNPEITLSCLDLSKVEETSSAMDELFTQLDGYLDLGGYSTLARSRQNTKAYGLIDGATKGESFDLVDLGNITELVTDDYKTQAQNLRNAIDEMVVYEKNNVSGCTGISVYYPYENELFYTYLGADVCSEYSTSEGYKNYISKFADMWINGGQNDNVNKSMWSMPESSIDDNAISMQLTDEQMNNYSSAYYTILQKSEQDGQDVYTPILSNCKAEPDSNGLITVSSEQQLVTVNDNVFPAVQTEVAEDKASFITQNSRFYNGNLIIDSLIAMFEDATVSLSISDSKEFVINNITYSGDSEASYSKSTVNVSNWDDFGYYYKQYIPKYKDKKELTPYTEWEDNGWSRYSTTPVDNELKIGTLPSSKYSGNLVCQIVVKDCHGNSYGSDLIELTQNVSQKVSVREVYEGVEANFTFDVYSDHAELIGYSGAGEKAVVPSEVDGKKVTVIGTQAFEDTDGEFATNMGNQSLKEIILPDTIKEISDYAFLSVSNLESVKIPSGTEKIGQEAFLGTSLKSVTLPKSLKSLGANAFNYTEITKVNIPINLEKISGNPFSCCASLKEITIDKGNEYFTVTDGYLCTKDNKTLICGLNSESVVIPKKVEAIGNYAFAGLDKIKSVKFSSKVKSIGSYAFFNTSITELDLPDKLERIGFCAFRNTMWDDLSEDNTNTIGFTEVTIPDTLNYIGDAVFSGQPVSKFIVSEKNKHFSSSGQFLFNKNGEQLIACGGGTGGDVEIPNGVKEIKYNAFSGCNKIGRNADEMTITSITVPDTVVSIKDDIFINDLSKVTIGKNTAVIYNYEAVDFSEDNFYYPEVIISNENKHFKIENNKIVKIKNDKLTAFVIE